MGEKRRKFVIIDSDSDEEEHTRKKIKGSKSGSGRLLYTEYESENSTDDSDESGESLRVRINEGSFVRRPIQLLPPASEVAQVDLPPGAIEEDTNADGWGPILESSQLNFLEYKDDWKITLSDEDSKTPLAIYKSMVSDDIMALIVVETNRYARQTQIKILEKFKDKSRMMDWSDTNETELMTFFSIVIFMGLVKMPNINLYWSQNDLYHNRLISAGMSRDRFLILLRCLHFCNNERHDINDKLYKVRPLSDLLVRNFKKNIVPGQNIVVDESMIPWRGRLSFKQYIKNKTHKYGVKLYKMCIPEGYTYNVTIYAGKEDSTSGVGHAHRIVMELMGTLLDNGRTVYCDNFYTSLPLAEQLLARTTLLCGTLRPNRIGVPKRFTNEKVQKGNIFGLQNKKNIKLFKWIDKRVVLMLSTCPDHNKILIDTNTIPKPNSVIAYNAVKKGVDYSDQMSAYYTILRKGLKWYRKVAFELMFGTAIVNSWVIYRQRNPDSQMGILQFRETLARSLLAATSGRKLVVPLVRPKRIHTLRKPAGRGLHKRRRCVECYQFLRSTGLSCAESKRKVKKIITFCADCKGTPNICLQCFNRKHNQQKN